jgi:hypothetical protein
MENPSEFAMTCRPRQDLALRYPKGSAPAPVARTAQPGKSAGKSELKTEKTWGQRQGQSGDARRAAAAGNRQLCGQEVIHR